jgi:hypothetical protein
MQGTRFDLMTLAITGHSNPTGTVANRPNKSPQRTRVAPTTPLPATRSAEFQR